MPACTDQAHLAPLEGRQGCRSAACSRCGGSSIAITGDTCRHTIDDTALSPLTAAQRSHAFRHTIPQGIGAARLCPDCLRCRDVPVPQLAQRCPQSATSAGVGIDTKAIPDTGTDSEL